MNKKLKVGTVVGLNTQEEYNEFVSLCGLELEDHLHIDREYVAYLDFDGAIEGSINIEPLSVFREAYPTWDVKLKTLKKWKRSLK